jgi:hypothetical protein
MNERIIEIEELNTGYKITTSRQTVEVGISDKQHCCETYGYFMSEDDLDQFINAVLYSINIVDNLLEVTQLRCETVFRGNTMFINFETSSGTLQFVAYNEHNGYYGHSAWVKSIQLEVDITL